MKDTFYVVAIGTSSGGLPILIDILTQLPNHNRAAFIIIQHLHKDVRNVTHEILAPYTSMAVHSAYDGQTIETSSVYVLPENQMMTVKDGRLNLIERTPAQKINHAVDIFFKSLGDDMKGRAIGIVLTGRGNDGTEGSASIHENGGVVMVQTPSTAEYKGMPQSMVSNDHPNFIMPIKDLVDTLVEFIKPY